MSNPFASIAQEINLRDSIDSTIDEVVDLGWHGDDNFRALMKETAAHEALYGKLDSVNPMRVDDITYRNFEQEPKILPIFEALGAKTINGKLDRKDLKTNIITAGMKYSWNDNIMRGPRKFRASENQEVRAQQWKKIYNTESGKGTPEKFLNSLKGFDMRDNPRTSLLDAIIPTAEAAEINPFADITGGQGDNPFADILPGGTEENPFKAIAEDTPEIREHIPSFMEKSKRFGRELIRGMEQTIFSSPQVFGGLLRELGERAEEPPTLFDWINPAGPGGLAKLIASKRARETDLDQRLAKKGKAIIEANKKNMADYAEHQGWIAPQDKKGYESFASDLGSGATTLAGALGLSIVTKSPAAAAIAFGLYQKGGIYEEGREKGKEPREAGGLSTTTGIIEGALEYTGLSFMLAKFGGPIKSTLIRAGSEGFQEWFQQFGENIVTQFGGIRDYTGLAGLFEGTGRSALIGVMLGLPAGVSVTIAERSGLVDGLKQYGLNDKEAKQAAEKIILKQRKSAEQVIEEEIKENAPKAPEEAPKVPVSPVKVAKKAIVEGDLPKFEGTGYRADTGFSQDPGTTAYDVVKFESDDSGNIKDFEHLGEGVLETLKGIPAKDVVWVTKDKAVAATYGEVDEVYDLGDNPKILAEDGDGGFLVLKDKTPKLPDLKSTNDAEAFGKTIEGNQEMLDKLQAKRDELIKEAQQFRGSELDADIQKGMDLSTKAQFYREAIEAATKTGGFAEKKETKVIDVKKVQKLVQDSFAKDIKEKGTEYVQKKLVQLRDMERAILSVGTTTVGKAGGSGKGGKTIGTIYGQGQALQNVRQALDHIIKIRDEISKAPTQKEKVTKAVKEKPKGPSPAAGSTVEAVATPGTGYGTIEPSERAKREKAAKTDYSKVSEELPAEKFSVMDEVLKMASPATRKGALIGKKILRKNIADLAHKDVVASEALKKAHKAFTWMSKEDTLQFIDNMEEGKPQKTPELQKISETFRELLDGRRTDIQNLGKGHLESYIENYFPHIWKDPTKAKDIISNIMGKKRLEGTKAFLKKRVIVSVKDGVERGLELVSENPVDLVLLKLHEMDRYIMSQNMIQELKERELIKFVYSRGGKMPQGYARVNDNAFTVYMPPEITKKDYFDQIMVDQMMDVARSLGIDTRRFVSIGGRRVGYAQWFPEEKVRTKFASPESTLAHEIGHILGKRYNLYDLLGRRNDGEWKTHKIGKKAGQKYFAPSKEAVEYRRKIDVQWRALADARAKGVNVSEGFKKYLRKAPEKEAVMLEALIHASEEFKSVAPDLYKVFTKFLNNNAELRPILDIRPSLVLGSNEATIKIPGFTTLGSYTAPEPIATLINNYLSPGLRNNKNRLISSGYNILRGAGNVLNQAQLALSLFHGLNVTSDMAASTFGLGIRRLSTKGQRIKGLTDIASTAFAPAIIVWNGTRIRKAYTQQMDSITNPKTRQMVEAVIAAGGRDRMDTFYYNNQIKALEATFRDLVKGDAFTKIKSSLKLPFNIFGATLEGLAKPLMEWYVPTGKIGLFAKLAQHEMERAEAEQIDSDQLWERLTQSWDSVDNRMGQLIYDNLFWSKTIKDSLMMAIRSVGWNLGSWREFGGAIVDVATTKERIDRGDIWLSQKMAYGIGAVTIYSVLGATIQYLLTGEPPEEPKDYLFPKTGNLNPDGSEERLSLPTYAKDWYAWTTQPVKTITHKIHPLWGVLGDLGTNKDYFNVEVRHTDDPLLNQAGQLATHIGKSFQSISMRNYQKLERVSPGKASNLWISITGISPAPSYITKSPAQKLMTRIIVERIPPKAKTQEEFERSTYRRTLKNRIRKDEPIDRKEAVRVLGQSSFNRVIKEAKRTPFADSFNRLSLVDAMNVYAIATPKEKSQVRTVLKGKFDRAQRSTKTPEVREYYSSLVHPR